MSAWHSRSKKHALGEAPLPEMLRRLNPRFWLNIKKRTAGRLSFGGRV
jgi:hypothetical protein